MIWKSVIAAVFIALAAPAAALAQSSPAELAQMNAELSTLASKSKVLEAIEVESFELLDEALERIDPVVEMAERRASKAEVKRWADGWEPAFKAKIAALRQRAQAYPLPNPADYPTLVSVGSRQEATAKLLRDGPQRRKADVMATLKVIEDLSDSEKVAAGGDAKALHRLAAGTAANMMLLLRNENNRLEYAMASMQPANPTREFAATVMASNEVVALLLQAATDSALNDMPVDGKAVATKVRAQIATGRDHAAQTRLLAASMVKRLEASPDGASPVGRKTIAATKTFAESADIELRLLSYLEGMAKKLEAGVDPIDVFEDDDQLEKLSDERTRVDTSRTAILAR